MKCLTIIGARPQFIKVATVSRVFRNTPGVREILVHTGHGNGDSAEKIIKVLQSA